MASQKLSGREASRARRQMQVNGKSTSQASPAPVRQKTGRRSSQVAPVVNAATIAPTFSAPSASSVVSTKPKTAKKSAARVRRELMASKGKAGVKNADRQRMIDVMQRSRGQLQKDRGCDCGGDCCKEKKGDVAKKAQVSSLSRPMKSASKVVNKTRVITASTGRLVSKARRSAMSGRGKVGLDAHRQGVSSASLARQANPDISSRELARAVRNQRSRSGAPGASTGAATRARRPRNAAEAMPVSGTKVGHTEKLTGDEVGLCHAGVTGTDYMASEIFDKFCQGEAPKGPTKVETTETLSGRRVTSAGKVGGTSKLTGLGAGSCSDVTGSEYLGREHFAQQCEATPTPSAAKVSLSQTQRGTVISGPKASRAEKVSGNEKGTCNAVTGTPYADMETFASFCSSSDQRESRKRSVMPVHEGAGKDITGIQPGLSGKHMTGAEQGGCQTVSGTPYLAISEVKDVCGATPASIGDADFPQSLDDVVSGEFSVVPSVVAQVAEIAQSAPINTAVNTAVAVSSAVTGAAYDDASSITGAFSMGKGKVTGTEHSRFGKRSENVITAQPTQAVKEEAVVSRVTGEGMNASLNITGNDWDRGEHVTGTEGKTSSRRNPTRRGPVNAMPEVAAKREPKVERESANVTGGSGGSQGSAVTVSGGARG